MPTRHHVTAITFALALGAGTARADDVTEPPPQVMTPAPAPEVSPQAIPAPPEDLPPAIPSPEAKTSWYGWQTLLVDGGSVALLGTDAALISAAGRDPTLNAGTVILLFGPGVLGSLGYLLGGPTVHWAHGHIGTGFASLGIRVAGPLAGLGVGAMIPGIAGKDNLAGALIGTACGAVAAMVVDAALLAREPAPPDMVPDASFRFVPTWDPAHASAGLKMLGTF